MSYLKAQASLSGNSEKTATYRGSVVSTEGDALLCRVAM